MTRVIHITGDSNSGKTLLICELITRLKSKGRSSAVIKHTARGFDVDIKGKDSARFRDAGASSVELIGPEAAVSFNHHNRDPVRAVFELSGKYDYIFMEGFAGISSWPAVKVISDGEDIPEKSRQKYIALFSLKLSDSGSAIPLYSMDNISELLELIMKVTPLRLSLFVNGQSVPTNVFVENMISGMVRAMVEPLKLETDDVKTIEIKLLDKD